MAKTTVSIEDVPLNGFHQLLTVRSGGGWLMDGYVLSIIGVAMVQFSAALHLTSFWEGMVAASALLGIFVGNTMYAAAAVSIVGLVASIALAPETASLSLQEAASLSH